MHQVLWNAARRLGILVALTLGLVAATFAGAAHIERLAIVCAAVAAGLFALALVPLARAGFLVRKGPPRTTARREAAGARDAYRTSARAPVHPIDEASAIRAAALAFLLLAISGAVAVVAAAAR